MSKRAVKFGLHIFRLFAVLFLAGIMFTGFLFWQLSKKPIDLGFAREAIEAALYDSETGNSVDLESVILYWPKYDGPLLLGFSGAKMIGRDGKTILMIDEAAMSFSRTALLLGKLRPKTIILTKPALRAVRHESGIIDIGFGKIGEPSQVPADDTNMMTRMLGYLARPGHEAAHNSIISRLEAFEIIDAQVAIDDRKHGATWFLPHFSAGFFSTNNGLRADFSAALDDVGGKASTARIGLDYFWGTKESVISADFANIDTKALGKIPELSDFAAQNIIFNAHLDAVLDSGFLPKTLSFNLKSPSGSIFHADISDQALPYKDLSATAIYDTASSTLVVDNTNITISDITIRAKADIKHDAQKIFGPLRLEIYDLAQEQIGPLWPKTLKGENAEQWIVHKMSKGRFQNVWVGLDFKAEKTPEAGWAFDTSNIQSGFEFKDMDLQYRPPLYPVTAATGSGTFDLTKDEMKINVSSAKIGGLDAKNADLVFDRLIEEGVGDVAMTLELSGPFQDAMKYLSEEPIHINKENKMDLSKVKGEAEAKVMLRFPARKEVSIKDFQIEAEGVLKDVRLPDVVRELDLEGGPLNFTVKDGLFNLKGKGTIEGRDVTLDYAEYLQSEGKDFKSKVKADLVADPNIRTRLGIDLSDFIEGSVPVTVDYVTQTDGTGIAEVQADITPAKLFVEPFDFEKAPSVKAKSKFTAHFKNKEIQKITGLTASGEGFDLGESTISFIKKDKETLLSGGTLSRFTLGETKGKLDFEIGSKDRVAKIVLAATFLDARPFLDAEEAKGEYNELPMMISVTASSMRTAEKEVVKAAEIFMDVDSKGRFNQIEMDAIAGASAVYLRYSPDETGKRTFRLKTDDAGAALRSFHIYSNIRGGKMVIYGEPVGGGRDRNLVGKAEITDFKAVKAPILTKLLSIMSVPGLIEMMSSDGLTFTKLEADFDWVFRKEGSLLVLKDGRTSGNSLGLTFDGTFDNANRMIDVKGTIVPMSEVNNLLGGIPLVGDILTGGSGGIFAATYSIKGPSENPEVGMNPLSVLTPGILRRILFE